MSETVIAPGAGNLASTILELDELWSFVAKKTNQAWIWIAQCRQTRQVVAYALGDRSQATCRRLWESIPPAYRAGHCFTDFWAAYQAIIPEEQHTGVGKEAGETVVCRNSFRILTHKGSCISIVEMQKRCISSLV